MKKQPFLALIFVFALFACSNDNGSTNDDDTNATTDDDGGTTAMLSAAFDEFDTDNVSITLNGNNVVIESNGLPNHTSPYWSNTTARSTPDPMGNGTIDTPAASENHPLFVAPTVTSYEEMAPGNIDDFNGSYTLTVPANPTAASTTSTTGLGPIGIAVSGGMIYNDEEGANVQLSDAAGSLDYSGAHTGPQSYHYHLEPKAWSEDDDALIGIMADGFFLYGRKCNSTGDYPTNLDSNNGHSHTTQHSTEDVYHYHVLNELYINQYYILFPGDYVGSPSNIQ